MQPTDLQEPVKAPQPEAAPPAEQVPAEAETQTDKPLAEAPPAAQEQTIASAAPQTDQPPTETAPLAEKQPAPEAAPSATPPAPSAAPSATAPAPAFGPRRTERTEGRPERRRGGGGGGGFRRRKVCGFCVDKVHSIDYKDPGRLRRYLSDRGRIEPRRKTGTCAKHQRWLTTALKRARHLALLPYTSEHIRGSGTFAPRR